MALLAAGLGAGATEGKKGFLSGRARWTSRTRGELGRVMVVGWMIKLSFICSNPSLTPSYMPLLLHNSCFPGATSPLLLVLLGFWACCSWASCALAALLLKNRGACTPLHAGSPRDVQLSVSRNDARPCTTWSGGCRLLARACNACRTRRKNVFAAYAPVEGFGVGRCPSRSIAAATPAQGQCMSTAALA